MMAFAPQSVCKFPLGDNSIIGCFREKTIGNLFEFSKAKNLLFGPDYPHYIWVGNRIQEYRFAKVLKTVAYVVIDEARDGSPVIEKWSIKNHKEYPL